MRIKVAVVTGVLAVSIAFAGGAAVRTGDTPGTARVTAGDEGPSLPHPRLVPIPAAAPGAS